MHRDHFGDCYDIAKRSLLFCLRKYGPWVVHPMFTEDYEGQAFPEEFECLLNAKLICNERVPKTAGRPEYFDRLLPLDVSVFFDPDKGLSVSPTSSRQHLSTAELVSVARARPNKLVMVFDQSFGFNEDRIERLKFKLSQLEEAGIQGFAYRAQACFIIGSCGVPREEVLANLISESKLPRDRFLPEAVGAARAASR